MPMTNPPGENTFYLNIPQLWATVLDDVETSNASEQEAEK